MDVDPPFFQKETDSSNEELREAADPAYPFGPGARHLANLRPTVTQSSSADDYRSVIDDLTVENKRLKEELKRYKHFGPDPMKKEKLFEIKFHGLAKHKRRELEAKLRDFAASLESSSGSPPQRKKSGRNGKDFPSSGGSQQLSTSSSRSRPVDSAYASMSTGPSSQANNSSKASMSHPSMSNQMRRSTEQKVEDYLRDTPDGLFPRHMQLTEKEKKKMVVRRLEQLFTGKLGKSAGAGRNPWSGSSDPKSASDIALLKTAAQLPEAAREAFIQLNEMSRKKVRSGDNVSMSNSGGDPTDSGGIGLGSGDGGGGGSGGRTQTNPSPPNAQLPEQRPTRPKDLDPDRVQVPSENMEYIRHLGLVPPEFVIGDKASAENVSPDADGWVYLNLLCNLAQLHMINVTPDFIRSAVSQKSTKFQLSHDGRRIRWRGGTDGTKFSSDSSPNNSQRSPSTDDTDGSNGDGQRKRAKTQVTTSSAIPKFGPQTSTSSDSFHYKPMFARQSSSIETSLEGTGSPSSEEASGDGNDYSRSGSSQKKRRHDGAIVYYSGARFCIDLSGDPGDASETTYLTSGGQETNETRGSERLVVHRTLSGSSLPIRPLSVTREEILDVLGVDVYNLPDLMENDGSTLVEELAEFPWCDNPDEVQLPPTVPMEASGLYGVLPKDHFVVEVTTRRSVRFTKAERLARERRSRSVESAEVVVNRLALMSTSSPRPPLHNAAPTPCIEIEYLHGKTRMLPPSALPPPVTFIPPFSTDSESDYGVDDLYTEEDDLCGSNMVSEGLMSQRANPHLSDPHLSENSGASVDDMRVDGGIDHLSEQSESEPLLADTTSNAEERPHLLPVGSSVATAGGAESGYSSSREDDMKEEDMEDDRSSEDERLKRR